MAAPAPGPLPVPGPAHLADPRSVPILSTEHWSLLTARSLVYNETFTRGGMFLTLLSASLVALGFVYQGSGGGPDFPMIVVAILALDLFVGVATLGRVIGASLEEFRALQAMARIRHAYLEMVPELRQYFSSATEDDASSVVAIYGSGTSDTSALLNLAHGITTLPGMLSVINAAIAGALIGAAVIAVGGDARLALLLGVITGIAATLSALAYGIRAFERLNRTLDVRFPAPDDTPREG